jgi:hypothetical protein
MCSTHDTWKDQSQAAPVFSADENHDGLIASNPSRWPPTQHRYTYTIESVGIRNQLRPVVQRSILARGIMRSADQSVVRFM